MGTHKNLDMSPPSFPFNILEAISNEGSLLEPLVYGIFAIAALYGLANALM